MTLFLGYGTSEFEIMPFGLMNAPATFQHMMDDILRRFLFTIIYVYDVYLILVGAGRTPGTIQTSARTVSRCNSEAKVE